MKRTLLFGVAIGLASLSYGQDCEIYGISPTMCLSDAPVALTSDAPGGTFTGPGVVDNIFTPGDAGLGTHTIDYEAPSEGYTITTVPFDPIDISLGGETTVSLGDDQVSGSQPIGFTFNFFGSDYTNFYISSNGFITFSAGSPSGCCTGQFLPNAGTPNNLVAFAWEDLDPGNGGAPVENLIRYETVGTAPNRILVMEFFNVDHFSNGNNVTAQVQLYETTNCIEIHTTTMPSDGGSHTMGIENASGTEAWTVSGRNSTSWTISNDGQSFCPNSGCVTSVEVDVVPSPTVTASISADEICFGEEVTINAGGTADTYSLGAGAEIGVPFAPTITGDNVYIIAGTDTDAGCVATTSVSVFVHAIPFVSGGPDTTICSDDEYILAGISDDEEVVFTWNNGIVDGEPFTQDPGSVTYMVTGVNAGDCEASAEVTVTSLEVPTGTGVVTMMTGAGYDGEIDFTPEGGTGGPYTFYWSNGAETEDISALTVGSYTVTVSDGVCDSDVTFIVDSQAGIDAEELDNLKIYPNPVIDILTVEFEGVYIWTLYDSAGKIVMQGQGNGKEVISVDELTAGNYHIRVSSDDKVSVISLVKE